MTRDDAKIKWRWRRAGWSRHGHLRYLCTRDHWYVKMQDAYITIEGRVKLNMRWTRADAQVRIHTRHGRIITYHVQGSPSGCCSPEIPGGVSQVEMGNTGVPILRVYMSLLVEYRMRLCITTPPVITFGDPNNLSPGVLYSGGVIYDVPRR